MAVIFEKEILHLPDKETLRTDEVANILSCSKVHIYHLVEEGSLRKALDIKSVMCRKPAIRILTESVREFVEKRRL